MILQKQQDSVNHVYKMIAKNHLNIIDSYLQKLKYGEYIIIDVSPGMRLDRLAHKYFSDSSLWWLIAKINGINNYSFFIGRDYIYGKILIPIKNIKNLINILK